MLLALTSACLPFKIKNILTVQGLQKIVAIRVELNKGAVSFLIHIIRDDMTPTCSNMFLLHRALDTFIASDVVY